MKTKPFATSLPLLGVAASGREFTAFVRVDPPRQIEPDLWGCSVSIPGWEEGPIEVVNIDGLGAMMLALQFAAARMKSFEDLGGRWLDSKTREIWPIEVYFSPLVAI